MHRYFLALSFVTLTACGSSSPSSPASGGAGGSGGSPARGGSGGSSVCAAGLQVECACVDGGQGVQACKADGSGYLACQCASGAGGESAGGESGAGDGGTGDGGTGGESGAGESGAGGESGAPDAGAGGTIDRTAVGTLNQPCVGEGSPACQGHAAKQQLICSAGKWVVNGTCSGSNNCDTTVGSNAGSCQPIAPQCAGLRPGDTYCSGNAVEQCGVDLVTIVAAPACSAPTPACLAGVCVECTPDTTRCSADQNSLETCSAQGAWAPKTSCGGGGCELCPGSGPYCDHPLGTYGCGS
jgi:hypothetical protein